MPPGSGSAGSRWCADRFYKPELSDHAFRGVSECFSERAAGHRSRGTGVARTGDDGRSSDAVAASPRSADGTTEEWADFPLIPPAWSGDGPLILL